MIHTNSIAENRMNAQESKLYIKRIDQKKEKKKQIKNYQYIYYIFYNIEFIFFKILNSNESLGIGIK